MGSVFSPDGRNFAVWGSGSYDHDGQQLDWTGVQVLTADDPYQATDDGFTERLASQTHFNNPLDHVGVTGDATPLVVAVTAADPAAGADPTLIMLRPTDAKPVRTVVIPGTVTAIACAPDAPWVAGKPSKNSVAALAYLARVAFKHKPDLAERIGEQAVTEQCSGFAGSGFSVGRAKTLPPFQTTARITGLPVESTQSE
jgi:hypothetical protein